MALDLSNINNLMFVKWKTSEISENCHFQIKRDIKVKKNGHFQNQSFSCLFLVTRMVAVLLCF